jgi:hypothetical protein
VLRLRNPVYIRHDGACYNPSTQEDHEFKAGLGYIARYNLKRRRKERKGKGKGKEKGKGGEEGRARERRGEKRPRPRGNVSKN